jgi:hypothetical protein
MSRFVLQPRYSGTLITPATVESTMYDKHEDETFDEEISFYQCDEKSMPDSPEQRLSWSSKGESPGNSKFSSSVKSSPGDGSIVPYPAPRFKINPMLSPPTQYISGRFCTFDAQWEGIPSQTRRTLKAFIDHKLEQNDMPKSLLLPEL